jgi:DNA-binding NarL/FixJ family response regulator
MIRIVVADDHTIVREGLKQLLAAAGDLQVVGEASDGGQVIERVRALDFDLLLLDM